MKRGEKEEKTAGNKSAGGRAQKTPRAPSRPAAPSAPKKRVTIADIARRAGVSPAAVSITLTDRRDIVIPESTRDHIRRCADAIGYLPSRLGEGFLRGRSKLIGILILSDSYLPFLDCVAGIQKELAAADYVPLVVSSDWLSGYGQDDSVSAGRRLHRVPGLRRLLEYQVEGILYFSMHAEHTAACFKELARTRIPTVVLGGADPHAGAVDAVGGDNEAVGRMVADHLLSAGCASFAFGMPDFSHPLVDVVRSGFASRLKAAGYPCRDFAAGGGNSGDLRSVLSRLVKPPAGVFCVQAETAAMAMRAAFSLGWWMPGDFAVVGMGQTAISEFNALPMTTVDRNSFAAGETAAKLLIRRIGGFAGPPQHISIPPTLDIRSSSMSDVSWLLCSR